MVCTMVFSSMRQARLNGSMGDFPALSESFCISFSVIFFLEKLAVILRISASASFTTSLEDVSLIRPTSAWTCSKFSKSSMSRVNELTYKCDAWLINSEYRDSLDATLLVRNSLRVVLLCKMTLLRTGASAPIAEPVRADNVPINAVSISTLTRLGSR